VPSWKYKNAFIYLITIISSIWQNYWVPTNCYFVSLVSVQPFAHYKKITSRSAHYTCVKAATPEYISFILNTSNFSQKMVSCVIYSCSEERTGFRFTYTYSHLSVICEGTMGFSMQFHLLPHSLDKFCGEAWKSKS
jgi:hypothetical protein